MHAETRVIEDGKFHGVFIGDREIGRTKLLCDAQMAMHAINEMVDHATASAEQNGYSDGYRDGFVRGEQEGYEDGYAKAIREVAEGE